ncbi:MAG: thioredoxin [Gemmiger sp.]|uniref:thioredoxin n=1 Tax=Gemmiger sp. TaxID=2049027 RepID=UPI002E79FD17|nr:thioredoxin [Gemmiger sp.]MEE0800685.1 thioredoxin [Gemmiger sp.]
MAVLTITQANFESEVLQSTQPVLLDFWATWCGPCQRMGPVVEAIAARNPGLRVGKVNTDEQTALAVRMGISSIPTLIVYRNGRELDRCVGLPANAQATLEDWLKGLGAL